MRTRADLGCSRMRFRLWHGELRRDLGCCRAISPVSDRHGALRAFPVSATDAVITRAVVGGIRSCEVVV
jgi:hypothetical protein